MNVGGFNPAVNRQPGYRGETRRAQIVMLRGNMCFILIFKKLWEEQMTGKQSSEKMWFNDINDHKFGIIIK